MKRIFIVGNWKSNKAELEAEEWLQTIQNSEFRIQNNKEIIVCPPFTLLSAMALGIRNQQLGIKLGAQDISPFDEGAYTGEVNGKQIKEFADYVIVGHSERRKHFAESENLIVKKIEMAQKYELTPIVCISELQQVQDLRFKVQDSKTIIAYEPIFAIGTGNPDTPENANAMAKKIKELLPDAPILYGGSVTADNVNNFTQQMSNIDGVLVGGASLDAKEFTRIIEEA